MDFTSERCNYNDLEKRDVLVDEGRENWWLWVLFVDDGLW